MLYDIVNNSDNTNPLGPLNPEKKKKKKKKKKKHRIYIGIHIYIYIYTRQSANQQSENNNSSNNDGCSPNGINAEREGKQRQTTTTTTFLMFEQTKESQEYINKSMQSFPATLMPCINFLLFCHEVQLSYSGPLALIVLSFPDQKMTYCGWHNNLHYITQVSLTPSCFRLDIF